MKIIHIAPWACSRVFKQVLQQQDDGFDVTLVYGTTGHGDLLKLVKNYLGWPSTSIIQELEADVVVVHTTISTHKTASLLPLPKASRYIWDCHDYIDSGAENRFDVVTCPSKGMAEKFKNSIVIYSKVPRSIAPRFEHKSRICAAALVASIGNGQPWSNYEGVEELAGMPVFIYPSNNKYSGHENELVMQKLPYLEMLRQLTRFSFGYAGAANKNVSIHDCVTNKFWDYQAAGCVPLTYNSREMTELLNVIEDNQDLIFIDSESDKIAEAYGA